MTVSKLILKLQYSLKHQSFEEIISIQILKLFFLNNNSNIQFKLYFEKKTFENIF